MYIFSFFYFGSVIVKGVVVLVFNFGVVVVWIFKRIYGISLIKWLELGVDFRYLLKVVIDGL